MSKFNLDGDPDKFQLATIVTKNSRTGITSNKRLLVIRRGHLYYYSNIPKSFTGHNVKMLENFHQLPKCSIQIINIIKINGFQPSSSYFSIEFQAKNMMEREDIRKTLVNQDYNFTPKDSKDLVTWQFTCDNQIIKQKWVSALTTLKEHYQNQQAHMQKYFEAIQNNAVNVTPQQPKGSSFGSYSSNRSSLKVSPWRQSLINRKSYSVIDNKYGIQMKQGNPKESGKIDFPEFLKKQKSQGALNKEKYDFELIIQETPPKNKIQEKYKYSNPSSPRVKKQNSIIIQEQSQEQCSIPQTPLKEEVIKLQQNHDLEMKNQIRQEPYVSKKEINNEDSLKEVSSQLSFYSQNLSKQIPSKEPSVKSEKSNLLESKVENFVTISKPLNINQIVDNESKKSYLSIPQEKALSQISKSQIKSLENQVLSNSRISIGSERMQGSQFHWLLGESCKMSTKFDLRLQIQKQLITHLQWIKQKAARCLSEWINNKSKGLFLYKTSEQSNKIILVEVSNIILKIGLVTTQNVVINGKPKIFFNEDSIKNLKRQYKIYQNLFKLFIKRLKSQPNLKIRMPLCCYMQYKGVVCIAFEQNKEQQTIQLSNDSQWLAQKNVLYEQGYKLDWFNFKTVNKYLIAYVRTRGKQLQDDENLKEYLKKIVMIGSSQKNHNIVFESPINKQFLEIAKRQNASTSIQSLERYIKGLKMVNNLHGECPKLQIITALEYCLYCKQLRKLYRSAQGQIDETHFFNLVLKQDQSMLNLLQMSNCALNIKVLGQMFSFIEYYFGVIFDVDEKVYADYLQSKIDKKQGKKSLFLSSTINPIMRQLPIQQLQIEESFHKLHFYIDTKHHLALAALQKKKMIYRIKSQTMGVGERLTPLYDEAAFHYAQSDFVSCIKKCKQYQQNCPHMYPKLFAIYLLMMKAYSQFSQSDFTLILKKLTQIIEYNYGYEHSSMINLFSLAAFYYFKLSKQKTSIKNSNFMNLAMKLLKKAEELCIKHFGNNSKQYLDILLDFSKLHQSIETNIGLKYLQQARKLCESNTFLSNPDNLASIFIYQADSHLLMGNVSQSQVSLLSALTLVQSNISAKTLKHLSKVQYEFGICTQKYNYCEEAIERLWYMSNIEKIQALNYAYKVALLQGGLSDIQNLINEKQLNHKSQKSKMLMQLQRQKGKHNNLIEMIIHWIQGKNTNFLMMVLFLINDH